MRFRPGSSLRPESGEINTPMGKVANLRIEKNAYCSYCGNAFEPGAAWPRSCASCGNITYVNPLPVAVLLVPVDDDGLLRSACHRPVSRAGRAARRLHWIGRTWSGRAFANSAKRPESEIASNDVALFDVHTSPNGHLLVFGLTSPISTADVPGEFPADETEELVIAREPVQLAFPLHNLAAQRFWRLKGRTISGAGE